MLLWSVIFLLVAIVTGVLAFTGVVVAVTFIAKVLFFISLVCLGIFFILFMLRRMKPKDDKE